MISRGAWSLSVPLATILLFGTKFRQSGWHNQGGGEVATTTKTKCDYLREARNRQTPQNINGYPSNCAHLWFFVTVDQIIFFCHLQELADGVICVCIVAAISHLSVMLSRAISHLSTCHDEKAFVEKWEYVPYKTDIHKIVILLSACCANFTAKKMSKDELSWLELQQLISQMSWKWIDCYFDNELYH